MTVPPTLVANGTSKTRVYTASKSYRLSLTDSLTINRVAPEFTSSEILRRFSYSPSLKNAASTVTEKIRACLGTHTPSPCRARAHTHTHTHTHSTITPAHARGLGFWDSALECGGRYTKCVQALTRLMSHHGRGKRPCPYCDSCEVPLLEHVINAHYR